MQENKLDCCVVRDLLPSYLEDLTEAETTAQVKAHLDSCADCRNCEQNMRRHVSMENVPKRTLSFLKRIRRIRLLAALITTVLTLFCMWWLYDQEFHYPNTEAGRIAAAEEYVPKPSDSHIEGIAAGTPIHITGWVQEEDTLLIGYIADNEENVNGVLCLKRGINGKYRPVQTSERPSRYSGGLCGGEWYSNAGSQKHLFYLMGYNCRDIYRAEVDFYVADYDGVTHSTVTKTYDISEAEFFSLTDRNTFVKELGDFESENVVSVGISDIRLFDKDGSDVTAQYKNESITAGWGGGKGTAEQGLVYFFMGITALLGLVFIRYFLRRD